MNKIENSPTTQSELAPLRDPTLDELVSCFGEDAPIVAQERARLAAEQARKAGAP